MTTDPFFMALISVQQRTIERLKAFEDNHQSSESQSLSR